MNEKVEVQIGARRIIVEIADLLPSEINALAKKVSERMVKLQANNPAIADSSKISLLVALSFAADLERERQINGSSHRSGITGRITQLGSPEGSGENFRAVLLQENAESIKLLIPTALIDSVCRAFADRNRVSLTGRMVFGAGESSFSVSEIARST